MDLAPIRLTISCLAPASWRGLAAFGILAPRGAHVQGLVAHSVGIEVIRARRPGGRFGVGFLIAAAAASVIDAAAARQIAHNYNVSTW